METKKINKKYLIIAYPVVFGILVITAFFIGRATAPRSNITQEIRNMQLAGKKQIINKTFLFPVKSDSGTVLTNVKYQLNSAELQYNIILNGQTASSIKGKVFLILNINLTNDYNKNIQINSRDYVRLSANNDPQLFPRVCIMIPFKLMPFLQSRQDLVLP
jgi:hypothetical protein